MLKKLILAAAGLAASLPAFADHGHRGHGHYKHRVVVQERYVVHRPVVHRHYYPYRPAPRPVYVVHHAPPPPPVVVHRVHSDAAPALIFGALVGAAVMHGVMSH